ncbi:MAG: hypothetical protein N4J56_001850 [Chroococcidiopsis sp. SAG 2025]|uniref:type I polyketide synthase n=1 Tax=Chroococcidiopsis sp. SAG 2025 TaxID=171389 RepID=UPI00293744D5|nr:SDR family oxidoreductase [Chroococcidiopsis sp. SAG 2025]MDV2992196.1 hypothetical protein [Chroococcidiopsis sp. SAG 2025]
MTFEQNGLEVAVIGVSGRFPEAKNVEGFWQNLLNKVEAVAVFSDLEREKVNLNSNDCDRPKYPIKAGAILNDIELFDAAFFGLNPREAETMDPQHRLFLECAWEALENAGYDSETEESSIGIYAGVSRSTYFLYNVFPHQGLMESIGSLQELFISDKDYVPTRASYKLNLRGPSVSIQTACSSSLVAVHLACQSLLSGECKMALAAGVSVKVPQNELTLSPSEIVSPDGHCRAFDARANGTIGGNGIGVVVLKRLEDAIADRDYIYAVIKGSAINNDGALKVGYTAPSEEGQAKVIRAAQIVAEVKPETISYMETHGTGTALGDPIEIAAMTRAFRASTDRKGYCAIGSVKTNVGHLDAAAGITGFIKTVLALHHKLLPPSLNFEQPNPQIDFANSPFYVNTKLREWKANGTPRRAGVSSFGVGGTNAHVVLEEAPVQEQGRLGAEEQGRSDRLLVLSAKTASALEKATVNLANYLKQHPDVNLADVAYTLAIGRRAFDRRRMVVVRDGEDAVTALESVAPQRVFTQVKESGSRSVVFMFPGQGAQYINMAGELYQSEAIFRQECDRCFDLLQSHLESDLRSCLYPTAADPEAVQQLQQTAITQPALFVIEYALAKLWMSWGVQPQAAIGHSIGEYVAACLSGVFSLEDALLLVATRGQLMQQLPRGAMLSVSLSADDARSRLNHALSLAASNAPSLSVVSGSVEAIEQLERQLTQEGIDCRRLHTSHAFHSQMMEAIAVPFQTAVQKVKLSPPQIPFISNVTGTWITPEAATDPNYWVRHLRLSVQFSEGIAELLKDERAIFLEVGPGRTLNTLVKQQASSRVGFTSLRHPKEQQSDVTFLLNTLGRLWLTGVQVDWSGLYVGEKRDRLPLPTYPFERQRYWIDPPERSAGNSPVSLGKKPDITDWFYIPTWKRSIALSRQSQQVQSCTLVFIDECALGEALVKRLRQQGQVAIAVRVGSQFGLLEEGVYSLNPEQPQDYEALLQALHARQQFPDSMIHLWTIAPHTQMALDVEIFERSQVRGFYSLLFLAQALGKQNLGDRLQLAVVSNYLHGVTAEEIVSPEKATVLAAVKIIGQEYPNINCRSIDVMIPDAEKLVERLLGESIPSQAEDLVSRISRRRSEALGAKAQRRALRVNASADVAIAYRKGQRWVQAFEPIELTKANTSALLRTGGVYLITGGLGNIGLVLAEYLAKSVKAKLILTGRSAFPVKDEWETWLATHDKDDEISGKIRKIQQLEALGAEVMVAAADVANINQMQAVIAQAESRFGRLNGVIHAAGVLGERAFNTIEKIEKINCERQFQSKVYGLLVLEKILQGRELDFCLLMSSLSSVLGGLGSVAYAAANLFMDAFVHQQKQNNSIPWIGVNWDIWQFKNNKNIFTSASLAEFAIAPEEGIDALQRILSQAEFEQVVVSTGDLQSRIDRSIQVKHLREPDIPKQEGLSSAYSRPNLPNRYVAPRDRLEQTIANLWQQLFGIEQVGIHDNFFDLGGESINGMTFINQFQKQLGQIVHISAIFEAPTVAEFAAYLQKKYPEAIAKMLGLETVLVGDREEGEL